MYPDVESWYSDAGVFKGVILYLLDLFGVLAHPRFWVVFYCIWGVKKAAVNLVFTTAYNMGALGLEPRTYALKGEPGHIISLLAETLYNS